MKKKSRLKSRLNSSSKATNTQPPAPESAIWLHPQAVATLADNLSAVLEQRATDEQREVLSGFVTNLRNILAMEAMRNVPHQGWFRVN